MRARSSGTLASSTSRGISRYTGPGAPFTDSRNAIEIMSAIRGMRRDLLMAHVDDLDAFVQTAVVDVDDMAAAKRPDDINPFILERLGYQMPTRNDRTGRFFLGFAICCHEVPSFGWLPCKNS